MIINHRHQNFGPSDRQGIAATTNVVGTSKTAARLWLLVARYHDALETLALAVECMPDDILQGFEDRLALRRRMRSASSTSSTGS